MRRLPIAYCLLGLAVVTVGLFFILPLGKNLLTLAWSLLYACFVPQIIIELLDWLTGSGRRAALYGKGWQPNWTHTGFNIRGDVDAKGELWISLSDCALASNLPLERRLDWVASSQKREHTIKGWLVTKPAMLAILDRITVDRGEFVQAAKLRAFLEREVWHEDEKTRQQKVSSGDTMDD